MVSLMNRSIDILEELARESGNIFHFNLAAHLTGGKLPHYAPAFSQERYKDPDCQKLLEAWPEPGQL
jgi:hypothetical protein